MHRPLFLGRRVFHDIRRLDLAIFAIFGVWIFAF